MSDLLHEDVLLGLPYAGKRIRRQLNARIIAVRKETKCLTDPDVSFVIRTRNNMMYLPALFKDIEAQKFDGKVEIILVDTESTDGTVEYARSHGAKIVTLKQADFTYPHALNLGFAAAKYPYVVTLVGHSNLVSPYMLKSLTYWSQNSKFGGMYGLPLPNWNASKTEKLFYMSGGSRWLKDVRIIDKSSMGVLAANGSIIKKSIWKELGGYDERYAGGGEDSAFARSMLSAGLLVIREPLCAVHHSHHLGPINMARQFYGWLQMDKPTAFNSDRLARRRPDLQKN